MRRAFHSVIVPLLVLLFAVPAFGQSGGDFDLTWNSVDGGGGTSIGGDFVLSGATGQPDAGTLSGGDFELAGGFLPGAAFDGRTSIPTVSEWGLIGMTLLALTVGKVVFGRRRRAAVP